MKEMYVDEEILNFCKALSTPIRMDIVQLLKKNKNMNINDISKALAVTNGALTAHIKALVKGNIIKIENTSGKRGLQKICTLAEQKFLINILNDRIYENEITAQIPIGSYNNYEVFPTCGLATAEKLIGEFDDPRYFDDPLRSEAGILWFGRGYISYKIPNYLKSNQQLTELQFSFEISSEAPGKCENWPSDIHFYINDVFLGYWTSSGDFADKKGIYTPDWFPQFNQYGFLKLLVISNDGTFVDGIKISNITVDQLHIDGTTAINLKFCVPETAKNVGGLTLFGKNFGNYNQDIKTRIIYEVNQ